MSNKNKEISTLIAREYDSRLEASVFSYILDNGIRQLSEVTEEEISNLKGNGIMTANFVQALVRTAVKICKTYTPMEIMEYIRIECNFTPFPAPITLYKNDYTVDDWSNLCCELDADEEEVEIKILAIKQ